MEPKLKFKIKILDNQHFVTRAFISKTRLHVPFVMGKWRASSSSRSRSPAPKPKPALRRWDPFAESSSDEGANGSDGVSSKRL